MWIPIWFLLLFISAYIVEGADLRWRKGKNSLAVRWQAFTATLLLVGSMWKITSFFKEDLKPIPSAGVYLLALFVVVVGGISATIFLAIRLRMSTDPEYS